ncbi:MAG TPA: transglycosylase domain-containing protein, partial [Mycobacteriales bacterium]|nr:transglycosylase domain-containing protein [Mycobacteriales bacterium]
MSFLVLGGVGYAVTDIPPPSAFATGQATRILYAGVGGEIGRLGSNRISVPLESVPDGAQKAVLAAEDRGFYSSSGLSPKGITRALFANVRSGGVEQGGSTIEQQYAKNAFLTQDRTFQRKLREVFIAVKLSRTKSKDSILEDYLNTIYFGRGALGIEAAAQVYFGRSSKFLTTSQGAVLAASVRSPAAYDPSRHPERAKGRWDYVLDGMVKQGWLSPSERASMVYPKVLPPGSGSKVNDLSGPKGHIITQVTEELARKGFPEDRLAAGGLVVQTSLRRPAQEAAVRAVESVVGKGAKLKGALVSVKPGTGEVFAYYGGSTGVGFDYANQGAGRQPGSSFKPYVLAA